MSIEKIIPTEEEQQEYLAYKSYNDVLQNLESGLQSIQQIGSEQCANSPVLVCGAMAAFDKGLINFLNHWFRKRGDLFLLSEVTAEYRRYTKQKVEMPFICTPHLLAKEMIILGMEIPTTAEMEKTISSRRYLQEAVENLEARHKILGKGYAVCWAYYADSYIRELLAKLKPKKVVLWNQFYAFHHIFANICKELSIPLLFIEFGCIPGTLCIEKVGRQGESKPARKPKKFLRKKVFWWEKRRAEQIWDYLEKSELNRNLQPQRNIDFQKLINYRAGRKTVTYMGQNDFEAGLFPYTENAQKYHSPIFASTLEALEYLSLLAIRNDWNLLYRPHPNMEALGHVGEYDKNVVDIASEYNINNVIDNSDVVVTILSQSAYIALIRKRPVVMLGYTQLKGKGCTYEAFKKNEVENEIKLALLNGFDESRKKAFKKHLAQLLKYYLVDDKTERECRFGRNNT